MILTLEEIVDIAHATGARWNSDFVSAIEAAVIAKLAAGVEPFYFMTHRVDGVRQDTPYYTPDQLRTCIAAARDKALEDAAVVCDSEPEEATGQGGTYETTPHACANVIRALKGTTP